MTATTDPNSNPEREALERLAVKAMTTGNVCELHEGGTVDGCAGCFGENGDQAAMRRVIKWIAEASKDYVESAAKGKPLELLIADAEYLIHNIRARVDKVQQAQSVRHKAREKGL